MIFSRVRNDEFDPNPNDEFNPNPNPKFSNDICIMMLKCLFIIFWQEGTFSEVI